MLRSARVLKSRRTHGAYVAAKVCRGHEEEGHCDGGEVVGIGEEAKVSEASDALVQRAQERVQARARHLALRLFALVERYRLHVLPDAHQRKAQVGLLLQTARMQLHEPPTKEVHSHPAAASAPTRSAATTAARHGGTCVATTVPRARCSVAQHEEDDPGVVAPEHAAEGEETQDAEDHQHEQAGRLHDEVVDVIADALVGVVHLVLLLLLQPEEGPMLEVALEHEPGDSASAPDKPVSHARERTARS
eukprot:scaffold2684_cov341-Prasinococcus_capsulatus_cf.AAC.4